MAEVLTIPPETQKMRRGHAFFPTLEELARIPRLYGTERTPEDHKIVHLHYFCASGDWYITELNADCEIAFGLCCLQERELGYVSLIELEEVNVRGGLVIVERDLYWEPKPLGEL